MKLEKKIIAHLEYLKVSYYNLNDKISDYLKKDIPKKEKLDKYYSDYLPEFFRKLNDIFTFIKLIEKDFKDDVPESKLNTITSQFKIDIFNELENLLDVVLVIDYDRALFEFLDITHKLNTDLKIEGKKINPFFKVFYDRMVHIKKYPKPELLNILDTSTIEKTTFENKFDDVQEIKVIEYFTKNLVDKKYITVEVLNEYLKQAFELKTPPTQRFSFEKLTTQAKIKKVFYEYFKTTAGKPNGRKKEYVKLLGEYFTGFDTAKLMTNFSK